MAIFGGGVRPELGRTDYGAVGQGSALAAQMAGRGSELMAQGLAGALAGAGQAVRNYQEKKELKEFKNKAVSNIAKFAQENPELVKELGFGPDIAGDPKAVEVFVKGLSPKGDFREGMAIVSPMMAQAIQQQEQMKRQSEAVSGGGTPTEMAQRLLASRTGAGPTAALINAIASAEQAGRPAAPSGISIGKYKETRNGQLVEVAIDQKTGQEIAAVPVSESPPPFESAYERKVGEQIAEEENTLIERANKAVSQVAKLDSVLANLEQGDPTTGLFAELRNNVNRFRSQFLSDPAASKNVTDTQLLNSLLGSDVFPLIGELGIGARGIDTPAERDFLRNVFTGTIELNKDTLIELTEMRRKRAAEAVEEYNKSVDAGKFKRRERFLGEPMNKLSLPERTKSSPGVDLGGGFRLIQ